ncbi:MAG TPA: S41 family peptidase [Brevundimonas sp.]|nr:S41 family peptidase [Brevundimonas sp.]
MREDAQLVVDAVEAGLPDIYWRQSRAEWDEAKREAFAQLDGVSDPMALYSILMPLLGHIGEGHLSLKPSVDSIRRQRETALVLPLDLHWNTDGVFVVAGYGEAADIPKGARLLAIDDEGYDALLAELVSMVPHDGDIVTGPMRSEIGDRYAVLRQRRRGDEPDFRLRYQVHGGAVIERTVAAFPLADRPRAADTEPGLATLEWLAPGLAYLNVPTFSNAPYEAAHVPFREAMRLLFEDLRRGRATRLILDLRENGGGSEPNESILFSFLVAEPLHKYAAVEARGQALSVVSLSGQIFSRTVFDEDDLAFQRPLADGRLTRLDIPPEGLRSQWEPSTPVFEGRLVVLAGGYTFSGGAELASMLRHARRGVFVGEEVGGADDGNTSGYGWRVVLPNSGLRLSVPLLQFRMNWTGAPGGRGVLPDCDVPPEVGDLGVQRDRAWRVARAVVQQDWASPDRATCPT